MNELINIGKDCVPRRPFKSNFMQRTCATFMRERANFRIAFSFILEAENLQLLYRKQLDSTELRNQWDIAHLFLCIHEYHDCFDGFLLKMLTELINQPIVDMRHSVLTWTLYVTVLRLEQDWSALKSVVEHQMDRCNPRPLESTAPDLFRFCKAMNSYATASLYTNDPSFVERTDDLLVSRRTAAFDCALGHLGSEQMSSHWKEMVGYFTIHILIEQATAIWLVGMSDIKLIQQAYALCKRCERLLEQVPILEPV